MIQDWDLKKKMLLHSFVLWLLRLHVDQAFGGNLEKQKRTVHKTVTKLLEMGAWCKVISIHFPTSKRETVLSVPFQC